MPEDLTVYCTKDTCNFYMDWTGCKSKEFALSYYKKWNEEHHDKMNCVHDYAIHKTESRNCEK